MRKNATIARRTLLHVLGGREPVYVDKAYVDRLEPRLLVLARRGQQALPEHNLRRRAVGLPGQFVCSFCVGCTMMSVAQPPTFSLNLPSLLRQPSARFFFPSLHM